MEPNEELLADLRSRPDALNTIFAIVRVREMGPADHIRTRHEVRHYIESGGIAAARALIQHAKARREFWQKHSASGR